MTFTLMTTSAGGELSSHLIRLAKGSQRHKLRVVAVDARADAQARYFADAFAVVPLGTDPGYAEAVATIAQDQAVDLILPGSDEEAVALAAARERVARGGRRLACVPVETLRLFADKAACYQRLSELGLPVPEWRSVDSVAALREETAAFLKTYGEVVIKPAIARGGRGVFVVRADLDAPQTADGGREMHLPPSRLEDMVYPDAANALPTIVMQRVLDPVHDLDMLAWEGKPVRVVPRRRVSSAAPNEGHTFVGNADLLALGERLIETFDLSWLYDCDVMYDRDGRPQIIEINPRPSGSVSVTLTAGVPLLDDMVSLIKGQPVPEVPLPVGRVVVPYKALGVADR